MIAEAGTVVPSVKTSELPSFSSETAVVVGDEVDACEVVVGQPLRLHEVRR